MPTLHPSHAANRETMAADMADYVEAECFVGECETWRYAPVGLVLFSRMQRDDPLRNAFAFHSGHDAPFSDETWARTIELLSERMATRCEIGAVEVHAPKDCETCSGYGEVPVGRRTHGHRHVPAEVLYYAPCEECVDGRVPCRECGEGPAVVTLDGHRRWLAHPVCEGCAAERADKLVDSAREGVEAAEPAGPELVGSADPARAVH